MDQRGRSGFSFLFFILVNERQRPLQAAEFITVTVSTNCFSTAWPEGGARGSIMESFLEGLSSGEQEYNLYMMITQELDRHMKSGWHRGSAAKDCGTEHRESQCSGLWWYIKVSSKVVQWLMSLCGPRWNPPLGSGPRDPPKVLKLNSKQTGVRC